MRVRIEPALAALFACGGAPSPGPPPGSLEKATTVLAPDGDKCPDEVGETRPVAIVPDAGDAHPIGRVTATRLHRHEDDACTWAEDGAASAARKLGGDLVVVSSRRPADGGDYEKCTVEVRVFVRGSGEFLRPCSRETLRGVDDSGIP